MYFTAIWFFLKRMPKVIAMLLNLVVIFLTIFLLVGCYNLSNDSTFLVRYRFDSGSPFYTVIQNSFNQTNGTTSMSGLEEVRIASGYMGVCVTHIPRNYDKDVTSVCYPRKSLENTSLYSDLSIELFNLPSSTKKSGQKQLPIKLNILELAELTSRYVVHPYLLMVAVILAILMFMMIIYITIPYLPFKYHALRAVVGCSALLVLLWGIGAMWTHVGIRACSKLVPSASMGIINVHKGIMASIMSWISFAFLFVEFCILWLLYLKDRKNLSEEIDKVTAKQPQCKHSIDSLDTSTLGSKF
ncbi:FIG1 (YBR040W) [Zygosaccharomyces parabailii]|nr:FIG1 (YBR040W) [Zygosaccharomyces parabailii]